MEKFNVEFNKKFTRIEKKALGDGQLSLAGKRA
jgi:hypothetical protein